MTGNKIMITGLSRSKQILYFFEKHQENEYSTQYISQYICNNFDLSTKKSPKSGIPMLQQINNEVSSNISKFLDPEKYGTKPVYNFERIEIGKDYFYTYKKNDKLKLPQTKTINKINKYKTDKILRPKQTNFNFEEKEIVSEKNTTSEIVNQDFNNPIIEIIKKIESLNLNPINEFSFSGIVNERKFTITVVNL